MSKMSRSNCAKCGNDLPPGARFCRKCGTPTGNLDDASTRALESSPPIGAPTTVLNAGKTTPAYIQPNISSIAPPIAQPQPQAKKSGSKILFLLIALVILAVFCGAVIAVYYRLSTPNGVVS